MLFYYECSKYTNGAVEEKVAKDADAAKIDHEPVAQRGECLPNGRGRLDAGFRSRNADVVGHNNRPGCVVAAQHIDVAACLYLRTVEQ